MCRCEGEGVRGKVKGEEVSPDASQEEHQNILLVCRHWAVRREEGGREGGRKGGREGGREERQ